MSGDGNDSAEALCCCTVDQLRALLWNYYAFDTHAAINAGPGNTYSSDGGSRQDPELRRAVQSIIREEQAELKAPLTANLT